MFRLYFTTSEDVATAILQEGFTDLHETNGIRGVYFTDQRVHPADPSEDQVTLCLDVPDDDFERFEGKCAAEDSYRHAIIPAAVLNRIGRPQIYDHHYAGSSRRELFQSLRGLQEEVAELRAAIAFLDRFGWITPLRLHESKQ